MTNPFLPAQPGPQQQPPAGNPFAAPAPQHYTQQPQQTPGNPYTSALAGVGAPASNGGSPWPAGATGGAPNMQAVAGQFSTPPPPSESSGGGMPKVSDLQGRLVIILPERLERGIPSRFTDRATGQPQLQDKMTATVIVLDGGPLHWTPSRNGQPQPPRVEHNMPMVIKGLWITQSKLIEQLTEALTLRQQGNPRGLALGRLWKAGTAQSDPYVLAPANPQEVALYDQYVSRQNPFAV